MYFTIEHRLDTNMSPFFSWKICLLNNMYIPSVNLWHKYLVFSTVTFSYSTAISNSMEIDMCIFIVLLHNSEWQFDLCVICVHGIYHYSNATYSKDRTTLPNWQQQQYTSGFVVASCPVYHLQLVCFKSLYFPTY